MAKNELFYAFLIFKWLVLSLNLKKINFLQIYELVYMCIDTCMHKFEYIKYKKILYMHILLIEIPE